MQSAASLVRKGGHVALEWASSGRNGRYLAELSQSIRPEPVEGRASTAQHERQKRFTGDWWQARIARQKEIGASVAAKGRLEYLYDKPYEDKKKVRVAGPFTVKSLSPHRMKYSSMTRRQINTITPSRHLLCQ